MVLIGLGVYSVLGYRKLEPGCGEFIPCVLEISVALRIYSPCSGAQAQVTRIALFQLGD